MPDSFFIQGNVKNYLENKCLRAMIKILGDELQQGLTKRFGGREGNELISQ